MADQKCQAASFSSQAFGWNYLNVANLFATRDNFRQQTADLAQLYRVISATGTGSLATTWVGANLDSSSVYFLGQSLGSITGILYVAAAPEVKRALFNVPGGDLAAIIQTSPGLADLRGAWLAGLATKGIVPGTADYDQYISIARWILDPADPLNSVEQVLNGAGAPSGRGALVQYITGDAVIPNPTTEELLASANRVAAATKLWSFEFDGTGLAADSRHGFLLNGNALTPLAQQQAVKFLTDGAKP